MLIDSDAHLATPDCFDKLPNQEFRKTYLTHYNKTGNLKTAAQQRQEAEALGVDHQVINFFGRNTGLNYSVDVEEVVDIMHIYNNSLSEIVNTNDGFFYATGWLAMQNIDASLRELDRFKQLNLFAAFIDDTVAWGRAEWSKPVFQKCSDLKLPIYIHFTKFEHFKDNRLDTIHDNDIIDKLKNQQWQLQCNLDGSIDFLKMLYSLIESNWLQELGELRLVIAERGIDWIKPFVDFCDKNTHKDTLSILREHFWFTTEPEHDNFIEDARYIGWDRLLFASDHGHDADCGGANFGQDLDTLKKLNLSPKELELIAYKNFQNLL